MLDIFRKIFNSFWITVNFIFSGALLISTLSAFISPAKFWILAFFGLASPYLLLINFGFIIYWSVLWRRLFLVSCIAIGLSSFQFSSFISFPFGAPHLKQGESSFRILSYNVRSFNRYNWLNDTSARNGIIGFIRKEQPSVICFQEFYTMEMGSFTLEELSKMLINTEYKHICYTSGKHVKSHFGIATFSCFPIINKGVIKFENTQNVCIYSDLVIKNDTVRVYNNHLQSIRFIKEDYDFMDTLRFEYSESQVKEIKGISYKLKDAFIKRAEQVDIISEHIRHSPYPVIVCGDFNDTPFSYTYHTMRGSLKDAFKVSGAGISNSYNGPFPSYRIDFILHSKDISSYDFMTNTILLSDHYPLECSMSINKGKH